MNQPALQPRERPIEKREYPSVLSVAQMEREVCHQRIAEAKKVIAYFLERAATLDERIERLRTEQRFKRTETT